MSYKRRAPVTGRRTIRTYPEVLSVSVITREKLLSAALELPIERVDVPELGGYVHIKGMTGAERDAWESSLVKGRGNKRRVDTTNVRAKLAVRCLVDESGKRLFENHEADLLGTIRTDVLNRIYEAAQRVCGVSDEDVDELEQASAPTTNTAPGSTSPSA
jgi:hypothetical protein